MSQQPKNQPPTQLDPSVIKAIVEQQGQKLQVELQRLKVDEKRLDQDARLAEKSMQYQAEFLKAQPSENRKTLTRIAYVVGGIVVIFLSFLGFLVYTGNKDFADSFLKFITYLVTSIVSFWIGKKSVSQKSSKNNSSDIEDAEIIDD
jgi:ABC-type dipeptide/oligopeptide/nickel transport system permease component